MLYLHVVLTAGCSNQLVARVLLFCHLNMSVASVLGAAYQTPLKQAFNALTRLIPTDSTAS